MALLCHNNSTIRRTARTLTKESPMSQRIAFTTAILMVVALIFIAGCSLLEGDDASPTEGSTAESGTEGTGTIIITTETVPDGQAGSFLYTGVPSGTLAAGSTLVVSDLEPGTYTTTESDPAPDFDLTAVECDDGGSPSPSSGDPQTRTAVISLDAGETVTCRFTNSQRGSLVIAGKSVPEAASGSIRFTGVPSGTIPVNGTLVVANLQPGTYTSTEVNPAPEFDLTGVECDDGTSPTQSSGDPSTRTAVFNLDPGEMITCTFTNTRRGTAIVASQIEPEDAAGSLLFTGVPSGTIPTNGSLVAADLVPGTYTTTEADPSPEFELSAVECDDEGSPTASSGDPSTRSAVFNIDPGETVTCLFTNVQPGAGITPTVAAGGASGGTSTGDGSSGSGEPAADGTNPFENPDPLMEDFPQPDELPPGAGTFAAPKPGPWSVTHYAGKMDCGLMSLDIPASPPESGVLEVLDGGQTVIGTGLEDAQGVAITMNAEPMINGRYTGSFQGMEEGVPVTINYFWQVVTDEHIVGFLTASVTAEGVTCSIYRSFEMFYTG